MLSLRSRFVVKKRKTCTTCSVSSSSCCSKTDLLQVDFHSQIAFTRRAHHDETGICKFALKFIGRMFRRFVSYIYIYCIYGVYAVKIRWLALGCLFFLWFCFGTCRRLGFPRRNTMMHWHSLVLWVADSFAVRLQNSTLETVRGEDGTIVLNQLLPRFCTGVCVPVPFSLSFSGLDDRAAFLRWLKYWKRGALQHKEHITSF